MQPCPRQQFEATMAVQLQHQSHWREDGTCSYCGSLSPEQFFAAIDAGCELGPTDKNYKVYVTRPDPNVGKPRIVGAANHKREGDGWIEVTAENVETLPQDGLTPKVGEYVQVGVYGLIRHDKFYFQHLNEDERKRFVDLLNAKKLTISHPGFFYRLPFFVVREQ